MSMFSGDGIGHGPRFQDPYGLVPDPLRNVTLALDGDPLEAVLVIDDVTGDRVIVSH